jgi:23S rRNA (uridine2552-2'-O)-methyltransferase
VTRWYQEKKREGFYRQAKKEGYRARSAYKLQQIQGKFRIVRRDDAVVDLGSSPGGWTQVLLEIVGGKGAVVGVDLATTPPLEGAVLLRGDMTKPETVARVREALAHARPHGRADAVVSDMSPNISGNYDRDQAESAWLAGHALAFARQVLRPGGNLVVKVFEGQDFDAFLEDVQGSFARVKRFSPPASRKQSSEIYVIGLGFRG